MSARSSKSHVVPNIVQGQNGSRGKSLSDMDYTVVLLSGEVLLKQRSLLQPWGKIMRLDRERGRRGEAADVERS